MDTRLVVGCLLFVVGCGVGPIDTSGSDTPNAPTEGPGVGSDAPGIPGGGGDAGGTGTPTPGNNEPVASGAFVGAPAYREMLGPSTIDTTGKGNGHLSFNAQGNPAGRACLTCHDGGGKGGAPAFLFAGTVYTDKAGTKVAAGAEVRVLGADGKGLSAWTDSNGNFFFREKDGATKVPAIAGVRNAASMRSMANKINDGNCNQCHDATMRLAF